MELAGNLKNRTRQADKDDPWGYELEWGAQREMVGHFERADGRSIPLSLTGCTPGWHLDGDNRKHKITRPMLKAILYLSDLA